MRIQNKGRFCFTAILLVFTLVFIVMALQYRESARQIPLIFAIPTALLGVLMLFAERYPRLIRVFDVSLQDLVKTDTSKFKDKDEGGSTNPHGAMITLAWVVGYFLSIVFIGFLIATPIFTLLYTIMQWRVAILKAIIISVFMLLILYFGFNMFMLADLFPGSLLGGILPPL
ncbi:tripartite tricarboxylate transporter TctB family protein [Chloroflexota bacterium]